jgi:putative salt-induced outer membrane protein YdiY
LWEAQLAASIVGTGGNSDTSSAGAEFTAHRRGAVWLVDAGGTAAQSRNNDEKTAERYLAVFRSQRKLTPTLGLSAGESIESDRFAGIHLRSILDAGLTWALVRRTRWTVDGVTSLAWNSESRTVGSRVDDTVGLLQLLSRVAFGAAGDMTQRITYYPDFKTASAYRSEVELAAQAAMAPHLALRFGYLLRYSNAPVPGFKKADNTTTASVILRWKATTPAPTP